MFVFFLGRILWRFLCTELLDKSQTLTVLVLDAWLDAYLIHILGQLVFKFRKL